MTFTELAQQLDQEYKAKLEALDKRAGELDTQASQQATTANELEAERIRLATFERELLAQNEEVSRKLQIVLSSEQAQQLKSEAAALTETANKKLKMAEDKLLEAQQKLDEQTKRELELVEKQQTYREEIRKEVAEKMLGLKI